MLNTAGGILLAILRTSYVTRANRLTREMYGALPEDRTVIERAQGAAHFRQLARVALVCFVAAFSCGLAAVSLWPR